ncbi:hypothetical protein [Helicobacter anatolicus]|uniref:hypothetical protein n=1 Tax=Helicobacter anatolicus TaxID=2905874 RepID=UPI001E2A1E24|nr:hypothetical protein [Helicobacter anatolicus]MCE3037703.1 hypothetical protein [Helicobacter anatolicus]
MKDSQTLISNVICQLPKTLAEKIHSSQNLRRINIFLPLHIKNAIRFFVLKQNQILVAFNNEAVLWEFNKYHTKKLVETIKENKEFFPFLPENFTIRGYIPRYTKESQPLPQVLCFKEPSEGKFTNYLVDPTLSQIFENIREAIIKNYKNDHSTNSK